MNITGINPGLVGSSPKVTSGTSRSGEGASPRGRSGTELQARFIDKASALQGSADSLARAIESSQRVVSAGQVSSSRSLDLDESAIQMSGPRVSRRAPDSKRPLAQVASFSGVRKGDFSVNGYQVAVDPFTDSLSDVLARIELTAPNTRATFSAASNKVFLATRGDRQLVLADGEAAFLQAISVLPGRFAAADAARDAQAAEDAARAADAASAAQAGGAGAQSSAAAQTAKAAQATAEQSARAAEQSAARAEIASAVSNFQESFNQFAAIEEPLVTYDNGGQVNVAASGRTQLDRLVSATFGRAGLEGSSAASARFDVGPDLSFRFDNPRSVMQVDADSIAAAATGEGSPASRFLLGDQARGTTGLVQALSSRLGDVLQLARGEAAPTLSPSNVA